MRLGRGLLFALIGLVLFGAHEASADYQRDVFTKLHQFPNMAAATDAQCLECHKEILSNKVRQKAPSGLKASSVLAWYETLDTYKGEQDTFHRRHMVTPYAKQVMNMSCTTCHQGQDPREEAIVPASTGPGGKPFNLRKQVNVEQTCLMCHGKYPYENMAMDVDWPETRATLEVDGVKNGCLTCHAEMFRTNRHKVNFLNAAKIEELAQDSSDVCYGCHGGRSWYRISFPYPRHPWPDMPEETPDWAKDRPTQSLPRFLTGLDNAQDKK